MNFYILQGYQIPCEEDIMIYSHIPHKVTCSYNKEVKDEILPNIKGFCPFSYPESNLCSRILVPNVQSLSKNVGTHQDFY